MTIQTLAEDAVHVDPLTFLKQQKEAWESNPLFADIKPDHYYEQGGIPVFKPTMEQFKDFYGFVSAIDHYGMRSGIVKIIPPKEWSEALPPLDEDKLNAVKINTAIKQYLTGTGGIMTQMNVSNRKRMNIKQWKDYCATDEHRTPGFNESGSVSAPFKKRRAVKEEEPVSSDTEKTSQAGDDQDRTAGNRFKREDVLPEPFDTSSAYLKELERNYWRNLTFLAPVYGADIPGSLFDDAVQEWNVAHLDNLLNRVKVSIPGVNKPYLYFGMWKATFAWHLEDMDLYSINYIHFGAPKQWYSIPQEHRERFERSVQSIFAPTYQECNEFLRHKTTLISPTFLAKQSIPVHKCVQKEGEFVITYPYGYHAGFNYGYNCAESINFATKNWIDIGRKAKSCECVEHSVKIDIDAMFAPPNAKKAVRVLKEKEVKIKLPRCCMCGQEGDDLIDLVPESELYVQVDENAVTMDANYPGIGIHDVFVTEDSVLDMSAGVGYTVDQMNADILEDTNGVIIDAPMEFSDGPVEQSNIVTGHLATEEQQGVHQPETYGTLTSSSIQPKQHNESISDQPTLNEQDQPCDSNLSASTANATPLFKPAVPLPLKIHRLCADYIPELSVWVFQDGTVKASGLEDVPKGRRTLKCSYCQYRKGACIQCVKGKCVRAYHPSCAQQNGINLYERIDEENGEPVFETYCVRHDPRKNDEKAKQSQKQVEAVLEALERDIELGTFQEKQVWARWTDGKFYAGHLQEDFRDRYACRVEFLDGYVKIVSYADIELERPEHSLGDFEE